MSAPPKWFCKLYLSELMLLPEWWQWTYWLKFALTKLRPEIDRRIEQGHLVGEGEL